MQLTKYTMAARPKLRQLKNFESPTFWIDFAKNRPPNSYISFLSLRH